MEKYIKKTWPEYQEYMEYTDNDLCGYDSKQDAYYILEDLVNHPEEPTVYKTNRDFKKGDTVLLKSDLGEIWETVCIDRGDSYLSSTFADDRNTIPGISSIVIGVKLKD